MANRSGGFAVLFSTKQKEETEMEPYRDFLFEMVELLIMIGVIVISSYMVVEAFAGDDFKQILHELIRWF